LRENKIYTTVFENKSKQERKVLISVTMAIRWRLKSNQSEVWSYHRGANAHCDFVVYWVLYIRAPVLRRNMPLRFVVRMETVWFSEKLVLSIRLHGVIAHKTAI